MGKPFSYNKNVRKYYFGVSGQMSWPQETPIQSYVFPSDYDERWQLSPYDLIPIRHTLPIGYIVHPEGRHFINDYAEWKKMMDYQWALQAREERDKKLIQEAKYNFELQYKQQEKERQKLEELQKQQEKERLKLQKQQQQLLKKQIEESTRAQQKLERELRAQRRNK